MASAALTAAVSLPSSKSSSLALPTSRTSISTTERLGLHKVKQYLILLPQISYSSRCFMLMLNPFFQTCLHPRSVSTVGNLVSIRAQVTTETPARVQKISKKDDEGVVVNKYKPKEPYIGRCLLNTKITGDDAPGETWHMVFTTEGIDHLSVCLFHLEEVYSISYCYYVSSLAESFKYLMMIRLMVYT